MERWGWSAYLDVLLGLLLVLMPFAVVSLNAGETVSLNAGTLIWPGAHATINMVVLGAVIAGLAWFRTVGALAAWASLLNIVLGAWLVISPWVLGYGDQTTPMAISVLFGGFIVWLAAMSLVNERFFPHQLHDGYHETAADRYHPVFAGTEPEGAHGGLLTLPGNEPTPEWRGADLRGEGIMRHGTTTPLEGPDARLDVPPIRRQGPDEIL